MYIYVYIYAIFYWRGDPFNTNCWHTLTGAPFQADDIFVGGHLKSRGATEHVDRGCEAQNEGIG